MSKELKRVMTMAQRGCIEDFKTIDMIMRNVLEIKLEDLSAETGYDYGSIERYLVMDGNLDLEEDEGLTVRDLIVITDGLSGDDRLFYAINFANMFQERTGLKWLNFLSAVSVRSLIGFFKFNSEEFFAGTYERRFNDAAGSFRIAINDKTTLGEFMRTAKDKTFTLRVPGMDVKKYTEKVTRGSNMIMLIAKGIAMAVCGREKEISPRIAREYGKAKDNTAA